MLTHIHSLLWGALYMLCKITSALGGFPSHYSPPASKQKETAWHNLGRSFLRSKAIRLLHAFHRHEKLSGKTGLFSTKAPYLNHTKKTPKLIAWCLDVLCKLPCSTPPLNEPGRNALSIKSLKNNGITQLRELTNIENTSHCLRTLLTLWEDRRCIM